MALQLEMQSKETTAVERSLWRLFFGACILTVSLILTIISSAPRWPVLPLFIRIGAPPLTLWALVVTVYAFHSLWRFTQQIEQELNRKTFMDDGTGVFNFRYLDLRAAEEYERTRRYGGSAALLFLDLDKFKQVNDRFGHQTGNQVLREIANLMRQQMRSCDILGRLGGDEFLALLPQTDRKQAKVVADRLQQAIEKYTLKMDENHVIDFVRVSIGIAAYPSNGDCMESIISAADKAVYEAKKLGGNQVYVAHEYVSTATIGQKVIRTVEGEAAADVNPRSHAT